MAIVNLTPDSFYDGGRLKDEKHLLQQVGKQLDEGADILDLGAASSRPGAQEVSAKEEWRRLQPALEVIRTAFPNVPISIDTWRAEVAFKALKAGAQMINDISGGQLEPEIWDVVAEARVPYVLMHMQGTPKDMQKAPYYEDVVGEQIHWFSEKLEALNAKGLNDVILDPGFGFGKTVEHNYTILNKLEDYRICGRPLLVGVSRKSMICKVLGVNPENALNGTTAAHSLALVHRPAFLRVHDVRAAAEVIRIAQHYLHPGYGTT